MRDPTELSRAELEEMVLEIRDTLYRWTAAGGIEVLDCRKVWGGSELEDIDRVFQEHGMFPVDMVVLGKDPA